jgi:hypothetical protein
MHGPHREIQTMLRGIQMYMSSLAKSHLRGVMFISQVEVADITTCEGLIQ